MSRPGAAHRRLPAEGYRALAVLALAHHGSLSKGRLAWELRANHPMVTKVLRDLVEAKQASVEPDGSGGYRILPASAPPSAGALDLFMPAIRHHYRFGRPPAWLPSKFANA